MRYGGGGFTGYKGYMGLHYTQKNVQDINFKPLYMLRSPAGGEGILLLSMLAVYYFHTYAQYVTRSAQGDLQTYTIQYQTHTRKQCNNKTTLSPDLLV